MRILSTSLPPQFDVLNNSAIIGQQPQGAILATTGKKVTQRATIIPTIKPKHYTVERVTEIELLLPLLAVADTCGEDAVDSRHAVDSRNLPCCRKPQPHRQIISPPALCLRLNLGVILQNLCTQSQRSAVFSRIQAQYILKGLCSTHCGQITLSWSLRRSERV